MVQYSLVQQSKVLYVYTIVQYSFYCIEQICTHVVWMSTVQYHKVTLCLCVVH